MKADGLRGVCRRKWVTTTTRDADAQASVNDGVKLTHLVG
jgi:hypothetical protein